MSIEDFKTYFTRDFAYLPLWDNTISYNTNEEVYYNRLFYTALSDSIPAGTLPTNTTYWAKTDDDIDNFVQDTDITKAIAEATTNFNTSLFADNTTQDIAFNYLTAHYLCLDIRTALKGVMSKGEFNTQSKGVGSVSESYAIPEMYAKDPYLNYFTKTNYGLKYLSIIQPLLIGNVGIALGATT